MVSNGGVLCREFELRRPSTYGRRPALPKEPAVRLLPTPAAGVGHPLPAPRQLVWVLLQPEEALPPSDLEVLQALRHDRELDTTYTLTQRFRQMMRARTASPLDLWLTDCLSSRMLELMHFASGSQREQPAGQAYEEADNGNRSEIHWDLVTIQRPEYGGGEVWFDGELIRKDGLFVPEDLRGLNP